jgi:flagellar hook-basal body complex protein FliE
MLMSDLKIQEMLPLPLEKNAIGRKIPHDPLSDFKKILNKSIQETNDLLALADQSTQEMILGEKDVHQAMIALEQANLAFQLMIHVRNKIISAYQEIMQMQI